MFIFEFKILKFKFENFLVRNFEIKFVKKIRIRKFHSKFELKFEKIFVRNFEFEKKQINLV